MKNKMILIIITLLSSALIAQDRVELDIEVQSFKSMNLSSNSTAGFHHAKTTNGTDFVAIKLSSEVFNCHYYSMSKFLDFGAKIWLNANEPTVSKVDSFGVLLNEYFTEITEFQYENPTMLVLKQIRKDDVIVFVDSKGTFIHSGRAVQLNKDNTLDIESKLGQREVATLSLGEMLNEYYQTTYSIKVFRFNGSVD